MSRWRLPRPAPAGPVFTSCVSWTRRSQLHVLGADVSGPSVARARERIAAAGLRYAEVIVADASVHHFPPDSFERAFSRFGIMFFSDPVAAFANVRRAMKPGGRLTLAVFRAASEKLWPNGPLEAVRHLLTPIPTP